jgi:hypothetical protein
VAQMYPQPLYDHRLVEQVIAYLQTRDTRLFPFSARFDEARAKAFVNDLREGLAEITDSGSKRGTSASGFITSDELLREVVNDWAAAGGGWPLGADPSNPYGVTGPAPFTE